MVVAVDVEDDVVRLWSRVPPGSEPRNGPGTTVERVSDEVVVQRDREYTPTCYVAGPDDALADLRARLESDPKIVGLAWDRKFLNLRDDEPTRVLAVSLERPSEIAAFAREVRTVREPENWGTGTFRLYDVDLSPKFRYCLETGTDPTPEADEGGEYWPRSLSLSLPTHRQAAGDLTALACEGGAAPRAADGRTGDARERLATDGDAATLRALAARLDAVDPDVLVCSSADLVPMIHERAEELGVECHLGRFPGHRVLAGENSYESYGRVGHSPARYDVPGRAIVDRSNSFFWREGQLPGLFDLVDRSWKPLQEASWASIGTVFTAMQIREARERGVVVPWRAWEAESFKPARALHDADRGGFAFEPEVGFHENVVEVDFASLYPRIMIEHDLSPETVQCACHDGDDVPGLGYSVCPDVEDPFVPSVLDGVVGDRYDFKAERRATDDPERSARLESKISALKWILVTCFGYQGYRNSKFGRIEVHESINAHARELLLDAKEYLEAAGWRVVHGIVDSLWVTAAVDDPTPIEDVCAALIEAKGIPLEHESDFEWACFVPTVDGERGSLTSYFGKRANGCGYKYRGIEARQRSTPTFVGEVQRGLVEVLDEQREPAPVADRLARAIGRVRSGNVDPQDLVIRTSASKPLADCDQRTRTVAALERYEAHGVARHPGQDVRYVVVDDSRRDRERVRLPWEDCADYDGDFYETLLVRAAESVVSPLGWDRDRIRRHLDNGGDLTLGAFG